MVVRSLHSVIRPVLTSELSVYVTRGSKFRTMATSSHKKEWLAILLDRPNVLDIRKRVKRDHYEGIKPLIASRTLPAGGAIFAKHPVDGEPALFKGSVVVYAADNIEQVREIINNDVYARSGVWDLENVKIIPVSKYGAGHTWKFYKEKRNADFTSMFQPSASPWKND